VERPKNKLAQDPLVEKVLPDPSRAHAGVTRLEGYVGNSLWEGHVRLYLSRTLDDYLEILESDVLHRQAPEGGDEPSVLTVKRDAQVTHVKTQHVEAQFLSGELTGDGGVLRQTIPGAIAGGDRTEREVDTRYRECHSETGPLSPCISKVSLRTIAACPACTFAKTCVRGQELHIEDD
jgi:hypothetical protein